MLNFLKDRQKRKDFFIGMVGGLIISGLFIFALFSDSEIISDLFPYFYFGYVIVMIISPIYFGKNLKPFIALGILFSYILPVIFFALGMLILWGFANTRV